jgi:archaellum biogenesis ATPase FlaH
LRGRLTMPNSVNSTVSEHDNQDTGEIPMYAETKRNLGIKSHSDFIKEVNAMPEVENSIEHILPMNELLLIIGDPWEGKSLLAQNLAYSYGAGSDFHGLKLHKCRALYITWEGNKRGLANRFQAMYEDLNPDMEPLILRQNDEIFIDTAKGFKAMRDLLRSAKSMSPDLGVVIFDSFPYTFSGDCVNEVQVKGWFANLKKLIEEFNFTPIVVWELVKLTIDGNKPREQFTLSRIKGTGAVAYRANTVIAVGLLRKVAEVSGKSERVDRGHRLVLLKAKDAGKMDWLEVSLDPKTLSFKGQKWLMNAVDCSGKAVENI